MPASQLAAAFAPDVAVVEPELSVVMPCLNEAETVATCVRWAVDAMRDHGIQGEVIVADNGSSDGSQELARAAGARVVPVADRGYGAALMGGIAAARGTYVLMGDADQSYDFRHLPAFVDRLREGHDLVQGCRLPAGGGTILPGAMPTLHRWWGNPMFSWLARRWFKAPIHDIYCGMRGFRRNFYHELEQRCTGMEFATEMIIKASLSRARIAEVPITLHPDGRTNHPPHLKTFRDGWRTLRFFLMCSPRSLYGIPGGLLIGLGLLGYALAMPRLTIGGVTFDVHTLLVASLAILCGYQAVLFAGLTKMFATSAGILPRDAGPVGPPVVTLERGLIAGAISIVGGLAMIGGVTLEWVHGGFGPLEYARTLRWVIPGMTLCAFGVLTVLASFFFSVLGMKHR